MELKNIFKMTKTDRYTQDGRDELAKLQETEDVKYKTGDISQKTGLQKQPDGSWAPPNKGGKPAAKKEAGSINRTPERIAKETAIMEALNLSTGEDNNLHKMSDETIERLYAKTQEKPAAGKTTIRQGPNTKTLNETPAEHIQKNLDAYKGNQPGDMEGLVLGPSGYKRQTSARIPSGGQSITYTKEGEEDITLFFDKDGELENADVSAGSKPAAEQSKSKTYTSKEGRRNFRAALEDNPKDAYDFSKTVEHSIPMSAGDKEQLANIKSFMQDENTDYKDAIKSVATGLVNGNQMRGDWYPEKEQSVLKIAKSVGLEKELMNYIKANHKGYEFGYSEDAAPRELTGDCKIRIRPETQDKVYQIGEISQKTGLQKTANGWVKPKTGAGKNGPSRMEKEEAIRKDLGLRGENDLDRFSDEQIEMMYQKSQRTPEQQKADFNNSKIGQAVNKGRQEFAAEKARQKELASKTNAIGLPKESKPKEMYELNRMDLTDLLLYAKEKDIHLFDNDIDKIRKTIFETEQHRSGLEAKAGSKPVDFTKYKRESGLNLHGKSEEEGEKYMKQNGFELVENKPGHKVYKNGYGEEYEAFYTPSGEFSSGSRSKAPIPNIQNHKDYQKGLGNKYLGQKKFDDGSVAHVYQTPEGKYEISNFTAKGDYNGGTTASKEFYDKWYGDWNLEDSAPRILTGDTKIRIKKYL